MPGIRPGIRPKAAKTVKTAHGTFAVVSDGVKHSDWNGKGGFKPGNKYGKRTHDVGAQGERGKLASDIRSARKTAHGPDRTLTDNLGQTHTFTSKEDRQTIRNHTKMLRDYDAGKGNISHTHAEVIRERFARLAKQGKNGETESMSPLDKVIHHEVRPIVSDLHSIKNQLTKDNRKEIGKKITDRLSGHTSSQLETVHHVLTGNKIGKSGFLDKISSIRDHILNSPQGNGSQTVPDTPPNGWQDEKPAVKHTVGPTPKPSFHKTDEFQKSPVHVESGTQVNNHLNSHVGEGDLHYMDTSAVHSDPHRFQYKAGHTESGSVGSLAGVGTYDKHLAGIVQVWHDPTDNKTYVVNGHNRLDLAKKLGVDRIAVRHLDAKNHEEARSIGALTNIAEGRGTAVDAAKYFKDTGLTHDDIKARGIPLREKIATDGIALSKLHNGLFDKVVHGGLSQEQGVIIGKHELTESQQVGLSKMLEESMKSKKKDFIDNAHLHELADRAKDAPVVTKKTHSLFGDDEEETSLALHTTKLQSIVKKRLSEEKRIFGTVAKSKNAAKLEGGGNVIDKEQSGAISDQAAQALDIFDRLKKTTGPVSQIINEGALRIHNGESAKTVHAQTYKKIFEHIPKLIDQGAIFN